MVLLVIAADRPLGNVGVCVLLIWFGLSTRSAVNDNKVGDVLFVPDGHGTAVGVGVGVVVVWASAAPTIASTPTAFEKCETYVSCMSFPSANTFLG